MPKDRDKKLTARQQENIRANIANQAGNIATRLVKHAMGEVEMLPTQVKAAQVLLDRCVPSMQSIEAVTRTEQPELSPEQVQEQLRELALKMLKDDPKLVAEALPHITAQAQPRKDAH